MQQQSPLPYPRSFFSTRSRRGAGEVDNAPDL